MLVQSLQMGAKQVFIEGRSTCWSRCRPRASQAGSAEHRLWLIDGRWVGCTQAAMPERAGWVQGRLLAALADSLQNRRLQRPGAFESPKQAAQHRRHELPSRCKAKPRLATRLIAALAKPSRCWGAGDRRPRLHQHPPEARRQAGRRGRGAGRRPPTSATAGAHGHPRDGRVRLGQPDRPAARGPRPPGRPGRLDLPPVRDAGLPGHPRVLLQRRRRADRNPGHRPRRTA